MTRKEAIEAVKTAFGMWECEFDCFGEDWTNEHKARDMAIEALKEQKTGKWQKYEGRFEYDWECSECGCSAWEKTDYCAHCGARMEREEE